MTVAAQRAETVGIVGAGSFGTALAYVLAKAGREVVLWSRDPEIVAAIRTTRISPRLQTPPLGPSLEATADPRVLADRARFIVMAVTSTDVANRRSNSAATSTAATSSSTPLARLRERRASPPANARRHWYGFRTS